MSNKCTIIDLLKTSFKNTSLTENDIIIFTKELEERLEENKKLSTIN